MMYNPCPNCGANLDPGEVCDCEKKISNLSTADMAEVTEKVSKPQKE